MESTTSSNPNSDKVGSYKYLFLTKGEFSEYSAG